MRKELGAMAEVGEQEEKKRISTDEKSTNDEEGRELFPKEKDIGEEHPQHTEWCKRTE
ncbi:hypothetical protein WAI453_009425 [Rhynchosporium graminicola]